jgi:hypothetical protein
VKREYGGVPSRTKRSYRTTAQFFGLVEVLAKSLGPTQTQLEALESSYKSTGDYLVAAPEFQGLLLDVSGHGSRTLGTLVRPSDESREGFDVDSIARLHRSALAHYSCASGPGRLLGDLHTVIARYGEKHGLKVRRWDRCVTLEYAGGMCCDIAPVIDDPLFASEYGDTHGRIPDRTLKLYDATNPRGFIKFFNQAAATSAVFSDTVNLVEALNAEIRATVTPLPSAQEVFERLLCRLIQLLKLHRNNAFGGPGPSSNASPTSVFLTTLAAKAYLVQAPLPHSSPLDLLLDIVETMPSHFVRLPQAGGSEFWYLQNPSAPTDNLAGGMNTALRQTGFDWWHARVVEQLGAILDAIENRSGMDVLVSKIEAAFGPRAARCIRADQASRQSADRSLGRVAVFTGSGIALPASARSHNFFGCP